LFLAAFSSYLKYVNVSITRLIHCRPALHQTVFLVFPELLAYQALTVEMAQRENEERLVPREILVPRSFQTGSNVFGEGVMAGILE